jgi:hypothetical protein
VAASAAALTVGSKTLPVYEIYKVGQEPHWVDGLDLLSPFGLDWTVVPHWNNTEGGNHDTRFCFMGAPRLQALETQLPATTTLAGLDEHTALVIDLERQSAAVQGLGSITLRRQGAERAWSKGGLIPLAQLRGPMAAGSILPSQQDPQPRPALPPAGTIEDRVWLPVETWAEQVQTAVARDQTQAAIQGLLSLEHHIHQVYEQLQARNAEGAAWDVLRHLQVIFATRLAQRPINRQACLAPLVEALLLARARLREQQQWAAADAIRDCLTQAGVQVEDDPQGRRWRLTETQ